VEPRLLVDEPVDDLDVLGRRLAALDAARRAAAAAERPNPRFTQAS
jgi:hypothetical protein